MQPINKPESTGRSPVTRIEERPKDFIKGQLRLNIRVRSESFPPAWDMVQIRSTILKDIKRYIEQHPSNYLVDVIQD